MGKKYLIDTNILIYAQANQLSTIGTQFLKNIIDKDFTVSFITYIEYLGDKNIKEAAIEFIEKATVIEINKEIIDACIELRKQKNIKLPDAIIAATALVNGLTISHTTFRTSLILQV